MYFRFVSDANTQTCLEICWDLLVYAAKCDSTIALEKELEDEVANHMRSVDLSNRSGGHRCTVNIFTHIDRIREPVDVHWLPFS